MPKVKFVQEPKVPRDFAHKGYKKGWEGEMSLDEANRWLRRGVVEIVSPQSMVKEPPKPGELDIRSPDFQKNLSETKSGDDGKPVEPVPSSTVPGAQTSTVSGAAAASIVKK